MNNLVYYDTGEEYFKWGHPVFINRFEEATEPHLHAHDFVEIAYVLDGSGIHKIGDCEYSVKKGDLFLINYNTPHEFRSLPGHFPERPLVVCNCVFKPEFIDGSIADLKEFSDITRFLLFRSLFPTEVDTFIDIKLLGQETKNIEAIYEKMFHEFTHREDGCIALLKSYVIELLILVLRALKKGQIEGTTPENHSEVIEQVTEYLKNNYNSSLTLQDLSSIVFLTPNYICRLFKNTTGITITEYVQKTRIEEACRLLENTDKKVLTIGQEVGYRDSRHFQDVFKRIIGSPPGAYRRKNGKNK